MSSSVMGWTLAMPCRFCKSPALAVAGFVEKDGKETFKYVKPMCNECEEAILELGRKKNELKAKKNL